MESSSGLPAVPSTTSNSPGYSFGKQVVSAHEESGKASDFFVEEMARVRREMTLADPTSKEYSALIKAYATLRGIVDDSTGLAAMRILQLASEKKKLGLSDEGSSTLTKQAKVRIVQ